MINFIIGLIVGIPAGALILVCTLALVSCNDSINSDQEQLESIEYYKQSKKGGKDDGNKTQKPEDH